MRVPMKKAPRLSSFLVLGIVLLGVFTLGSFMRQTLAADAVAPADKIEPLVLEQFQAGEETDFFVWMTTKADLTGVAALDSKEARGAYVFNALRDTAEVTQREVRAVLDRVGVEYRPFYIANKIYVAAGDLALVNELAARPDVERITANHIFQLPEPIIEPAPVPHLAAVAANISFVNADDVWTMGYDGEGIVLAGNDTGLDWDHPAIINQYRGWNGSSVNHNYSWWDATGTYPTAPNDGHGHGTHTTGTMVGDDGGTNQIGMAPGAKTIHCKNMTNSGSGSDLTFTTCFEWNLAPWNLSGSNPNPAMAPHAINNSWGYAGGNAPQFENEIAALRAAGIIVEVSAGNEGPGCATLRSPGDYTQSLTTGSISHFSSFPGSISGFSSRGPSDLYPGAHIPDVMAPGQSINSALPGGGYSGPNWSGTSMAGPHVVGLIGLIWDAAPGLIGNVATTEQIVLDTAVPLSGQNGSNCGGNYSSGPNNDWGHGTIDALAAVEEAIGPGVPTPTPTSPPPPTATPPPGNTIFFDNFETNQGWTVNPNGTDTATTGVWERGDPEPVNYNGPKQLDAFSGSNDLVTGRLAGSSPGVYDIDGGVTSIRSPNIGLPAGADITLSFYYYLSHYTNSSSADFLRVQVVGNTTQTVFEELGAANDDDASWQQFSASLNSFAGQTVYILISAADASTASYVEAAIDDVRIEAAGGGPTPTPPPGGNIFFDNFESSQGWIVNPNGTDTATLGLWERANPAQTTYNGAIYQLGTTVSGSNDLVTGPLAGSAVGSYDVDGGVTSVRSPNINLPSSGNITLSFYYYMAHLNNSSSADFLRVSVVGNTTSVVLLETGAANNDAASWSFFSTSLNNFAGQTVYILIEAADLSTASLVEAAIDDVSIDVD